MDKNIVNTVYHAAVVSGLSIGYSMLAKNLLKMKGSDMSKLDFEDTAKMIGIVTASIATKDYLVKQGIIPENIQK